jgi:hypothetical protein
MGDGVLMELICIQDIEEGLQATPMIDIFIHQHLAAECLLHGRHCVRHW